MVYFRPSRSVRALAAAASEVLPSRNAPIHYVLPSHAIRHHLRDRNIGNKMNAKRRLDQNDHPGIQDPRHTGTVYVPLRVLPCTVGFGPQFISQIPLLLVITDAGFSSSRQSEDHMTPEAGYFLKGGDTLTVLNPGMIFKIARKGLGVATTGFIQSAVRPEVKTAAVSGWTPNPMKGPGVLDNIKYFRLVQSFARILRFRLEPSYRDHNGKPLVEHRGRFVASHVVCKIKGHLESSQPY